MYVYFRHIYLQIIIAATLNVDIFNKQTIGPLWWRQKILFQNKKKKSFETAKNGKEWHKYTRGKWKGNKSVLIQQDLEHEKNGI